MNLISNEFSFQLATRQVVNENKYPIGLSDTGGVTEVDDDV